MATSSFFTNVVIQDDKACEALLHAIEDSQKASANEIKEPPMPKLSQEEVRTILKL